MAFPFHILTLFPEYFRSPLQTSILGSAIERGELEVAVTDIRDFATERHRKTDDKPYGGGAGMVMKPEPVVDSLEYARRAHPDAPRVLMTPQGEQFDQQMAREFADGPGVILLCGRYEGVDQRVRDGWIDREISIGDFVLSGGEPAAMIVVDAVMRLLPDVLGNPESLDEEIFAADQLEYPHYTRPREFRGHSVPDVLLSGDHGRIADWRRRKAQQRTQKRRPDLLSETDPPDADS